MVSLSLVLRIGPWPRQYRTGSAVRCGLISLGCVRTAPRGYAVQRTVVQVYVLAAVTDVRRQPRKVALGDDRQEVGRGAVGRGRVHASATWPAPLHSFFRRFGQFELNSTGTGTKIHDAVSRIRLEFPCPVGRCRARPRVVAGREGRRNGTAGHEFRRVAVRELAERRREPTQYFDGSRVCICI